MKRNLKWHDENGKATPLYVKWAGARKRCYNKHDARYHLYGGRGIRMCDEWLMDYAAFAAWAYDHGYKKGLSLDRIDNDGNYCPENCRFVTMDEQKRNRRFCHKVEYKGRKFATLQELADTIGISQNTLTQRLKRSWPIELAIEMPLFKGRAPKAYDKIIQEQRKNHHVCYRFRSKKAAHQEGGSPRGHEEQPCGVLHGRPSPEREEGHDQNPR